MNRNNNSKKSKKTISVCTNYGSLEIVNLKRVWVNCYLGCHLMYSDDIYEYNCIYSSTTRKKITYFKELKDKLIRAYNNGDCIVEL